MSRHGDQNQPVSSGPSWGGWRRLAWALTLAGAVTCGVGGFHDLGRLGYAYLTAYLCWLSLPVGGLFLVMVEHLVEARWSVPLRRLAEHLAGLSMGLAVLWLPLAALAPRVYGWMQSPALSPELSVQAKAGLLNRPVWYGLSLGILGLWSLLGWRLRAVSVQQDRCGSVAYTRQLRVLSVVGLIGLAVTVPLGAVLWAMSLQPGWCSAVYGVYYFVGSVWVTVATVYGLATVLKRAGPLAQALGPRQFHDLGTLWFGFTMLYAYVHFVQYFVIWNGNIPEHTWWYVQRQQGTWAWVGLALVGGHFLVPFLVLIRRDTKLNWAVTLPLVGWCGLMHYLDVAFNVLPAQPSGPRSSFQVVDLGCVAFMAGVLGLAWLKAFSACVPMPLRDRRLNMALELSPPEALDRLSSAASPKP
jgi:hypothetical protein